MMCLSIIPEPASKIESGSCAGGFEWRCPHGDCGCYGCEPGQEMTEAEVVRCHGTGTCTEAECEAKSRELDLPFSTLHHSNGAPAGCIQSDDGRVIFVETCSGHAHCGTTSCTGCSVLECDSRRGWPDMMNPSIKAPTVADCSNGATHEYHLCECEQVGRWCLM